MPTTLTRDRVLYEGGEGLGPLETILSPLLDQEIPDIRAIIMEHCCLHVIVDLNGLLEVGDHDAVQAMLGELMESWDLTFRTSLKKAERELVIKIYDSVEMLAERTEEWLDTVADWLACIFYATDDYRTLHVELNP